MHLKCETKRLILEILPSSYAKQVLNFYKENKEHIEPWEAKRDKMFYTETYQRSLLEAEYNEMIKSKMVRYYLFEKSKPDVIIGSVSAANIRYGAFDSCNIGYKMHKEYCGQGYCKEAVAELLRILFHEFHLHRIEAMVHPENKPSIAVLEGIGFEQEGLARDAAKLQGAWQDMYRYGIVVGKNIAEIIG
ncbi:MAG: GNAT family N-acetyltransferase [Lachnospiraceae bacterium]|nr:GNAT family N-acetyltransferase [Lachnospiraceae bacterium]